MYRINFNAYAQGIPTYGPQDIGQSFRQLVEHNLQRNQQATQQKQFSQNMEQRQKEHGDQVEHQKDVQHSINARFATEQASQIDEKNQEAKMRRHAAVEADVNKARQLVVAGRWNEAIALVGSLKERGADVDYQIGNDGRPVFNLKSPEYSVPQLQGDFDSINQRLSRNPEQPMSTDSFAEPNRFETNAGTVAASANPPPSVSAEGFDSGTQGMINNLEQNLDPATRNTQSTSPPTQSTGQNPYQLDTSQLQGLTNMRLDPVLSGIASSLPYQYQAQGQQFLQGFKGLGQTPEQTLETLQNPFNTVAGLWRGEMGANAAITRANMTQTGQESNRDIRLEDRTWRRAQDISKAWDLTNANRKYRDVAHIDELLSENNPNIDSQVLHKIRNMFQTGVATQPDIDSLRYGVGKGILQQLADMGNEQILGTGLNPDTRANLREFMSILKRQNQGNLTNARDQLNSLLSTVQTREEAVSLLQMMNSNIPPDLWTPEQQRLQEALGIGFEQKPNTKAPIGGTRNSQSASARGPGASSAVTPNSASATTTAPAVDTDADDQAERLLNGD
jgi:hypothetical protein